MPGTGWVRPCILLGRLGRCARAWNGRSRELEEEAGRIEGELHTAVEADAVWKQQLGLLTSIPGIGWKSAVLLLCELPPVERFTSAKQWAVFGGICPAVHESGQVSFGFLSRPGSPRIRKGLYLSAMSTMRCTHRYGT